MTTEQKSSISYEDMQNLSLEAIESVPVGTSFELPDGWRISKVKRRYGENNPLCWIVWGTVDETEFHLGGGRPNTLSRDEYSTFEVAFKVYEGNKGLSAEEKIKWIKNFIDDDEDSWG